MLLDICPPNIAAIQAVAANRLILPVALVMATSLVNKLSFCPLPSLIRARNDTQGSCFGRMVGFHEVTCH
jgi:hypothetical protein